MREISQNDHAVSCIEWSSINRDIVVCAGADGYVTAHDLRVKNSEISCFQAHSTIVSNMRLTQSGHLLTSSS